MSADVDPISSYQRDDMSIRARKARSKSSKRRALPNRPDPMSPTPERLAKEDAPVKLGAGLYRAPMPIERMRDRGQLDPLPHLNEMLFQAAEKLVGYFETADLAGHVRAQDLTRVVAGGGDLADERAAHCLKEFRTACKLMGWSVAYPHRGAGRITVAVVCEGMGVKEAAALHRPGGSNEARLGAGMDALREGLFALAVHWRLVRG
ncbi:MAG: hypothetical protein ACRYGP_13815 [Janthinobacterium lividum]